MAEVQLCGVRAAFTRRLADYSLSLSVHSLLLVDARGDVSFIYYLPFCMPQYFVFGRTVHAFARFSNELYLEAVPDALHLRTLNATESAYSIVKFSKSFFSYFKHDYSSTDDDSHGLKCKISMKSALNIFKSPLHMDKQVENLEIKLEPHTCKLIFQLKCKHGVVKTHFVSVLDCTILQSVYTKDLVPNNMSTHQRVLSEALSNFHNSDDLVTLEASTQCLVLRNYETASDFTKIIRTQINLKPSEFDSYTIGVDTTISFPLKEFKAILAFAEALGLQIQLHFQTTGMPVVFVVQNNATFEADFVLATSRADGSTQSTTQTTVVGRREKKRKETTPSVSNVTKKAHLEDGNLTDCLEEDSHLFNFIEMPEEANRNRSFNTETSNGHDRSNVNCDINCNSFSEKGDDDMMENDIMPSPTSKNTVKLVFSRCLEATFDLRCLQGTVFADNSDSE